MEEARHRKSQVLGVRVVSVKHEAPRVDKPTDRAGGRGWAGGRECGWDQTED